MYGRPQFSRLPQRNFQRFLFAFFVLATLIGVIPIAEAACPSAIPFSVTADTVYDGCNDPSFYTLLSWPAGATITLKDWSVLGLRISTSANPLTLIIESSTLYVINFAPGDSVADVNVTVIDSTLTGTSQSASFFVVDGGSYERSSFTCRRCVLTDDAGSLRASLVNLDSLTQGSDFTIALEDTVVSSPTMRTQSFNLVRISGADGAPAFTNLQVSLENTTMEVTAEAPKDLVGLFMLNCTVASSSFSLRGGNATLRTPAANINSGAASVHGPIVIRGSTFEAGTAILVEDWAVSTAGVGAGSGMSARVSEIDGSQFTGGASVIFRRLMVDATNDVFHNVVMLYLDDSSLDSAVLAVEDSYFNVTVVLRNLVIDMNGCTIRQSAWTISNVTAELRVATYYANLLRIDEGSAVDSTILVADTNFTAIRTGAAYASAFSVITFADGFVAQGLNFTLAGEESEFACRGDLSLRFTLSCSLAGLDSVTFEPSPATGTRSSFTFADVATSLTTLAAVLVEVEDATVLRSTDMTFNNVSMNNVGYAVGTGVSLVNNSIVDDVNIVASGLTGSLTSNVYASVWVTVINGSQMTNSRLKIVDSNVTITATVGLMTAIVRVAAQDFAASFGETSQRLFSSVFVVGDGAELKQVQFSCEQSTLSLQGDDGATVVAIDGSLTAANSIHAKSVSSEFIIKSSTIFTKGADPSGVFGMTKGSQAIDSHFMIEETVLLIEGSESAGPFGVTEDVQMHDSSITLRDVNATVTGKVAFAVAFRGNVTLSNVSVRVDDSNITTSSTSTAGTILHNKVKSSKESIVVSRSTLSADSRALVYSIGSRSDSVIEDMTVHVVSSTLRSSSSDLTYTMLFYETLLTNTAVTFTDSSMVAISSSSDGEVLRLAGTTSQVAAIHNFSAVLLRSNAHAEGSVTSAMICLGASLADLNNFSIRTEDSTIRVKNTLVGHSMAIGFSRSEGSISTDLLVEMIRSTVTVNSGNSASAVGLFYTNVRGLRAELIGSNYTMIGGIAAMIFAGITDSYVTQTEVVVEDVVARTDPTNVFLGASSFFYFLGGAFNDSSLTTNRLQWTGTSSSGAAAGLIGVPSVFSTTQFHNSNFTIRGTTGDIPSAGMACGVGLLSSFLLKNVRFDFDDTHLVVSGSSLTIGLVMMSQTPFDPEQLVINVTRSSVVATTDTTLLTAVLNVMDPIIAIVAIVRTTSSNLRVKLEDVSLTASSKVTSSSLLYLGSSPSTGLSCSLKRGVIMASSESGSVSGVSLPKSRVNGGSLVWDDIAFSADSASGSSISSFDFSRASFENVNVDIHNLRANMVRSDATPSANVTVVALPPTATNTTLNLSSATVGLEHGGTDGKVAVVGFLAETTDMKVSVVDVDVNTSASIVMVVVDEVASPATPSATLSLDRVLLEKGISTAPAVVAVSADSSPPSRRASIGVAISCVNVANERLLTVPFISAAVDDQFARYAPLTLQEQLATCNPKTATPIVKPYSPTTSETRTAQDTRTPSTSLPATSTTSRTSSLIPPLPLCADDARLLLAGSPLAIDGKPARGYFFDPGAYGIQTFTDDDGVPAVEVDDTLLRKNGMNISLSFGGVEFPQTTFAFIDESIDPVTVTCRSPEEGQRDEALAACEAFLSIAHPHGNTSSSIVGLPPVFFELPRSSKMRTLALLFRPAPMFSSQLPFELELRVRRTSLGCADMAESELHAKVRVTPETPASIEVASAATAAAAAVASVSAAASPPTVADAQALAVFSLISCSSSDSRYAMRQAALLLSPLSLGPEPEGALWGNLVLVLAMLALQVTIIGIIYSVKKFIRKSKDINMTVLQADARFPSLFVTYAMLFHQGTAVLSLRLLLDGHVSFVVVVAALLAVSFPWVVFMYSQRLTVPTFETDISSKLVFFKYVGVGENWPASIGPTLRRWLVPVGRWGPPLVRKRFGGPVGAVLPLWVRFAAVPPLQATLVSFVASVKTGSRPGCAAQYAALIALYVVFGLAVVAVRPYRSRFLNVSQVVSYLLLSAILVLQMVRALWPEEYGPQAWMPPPLVCITVVASLRGVYGYWLMVCERCFWRAQGGKVFWCEVRDGTATRDAYEEMVTVETSGRQERVDLRELAAREKLLMTPGQDSVEMKKPSRNRASSGLVDLEELLLDSSQPPHLQGQAAV